MQPHFTPETLTFLRGLARHNDREWFEARRDIYEHALKAPMLAIIEDLNHTMLDFAPEHVRPPHKIMMRIYRDTRFSPDKRPYKTHLAAWWSRRGMEKTSGAGFYLQISPQEVLLAAGVYMPAREQLLALRRWMAGHHQAYRAGVQRLLNPRRAASARASARTHAAAFRRHPERSEGPPHSARGGQSPSVLAAAFQPIDPQALRRMPQSFPPDHPAGDLLRARNWGVRLFLPAELALDPSLCREVAQRFRLAAPLVAQLNSAILDPSGPAAHRNPAPHPA